MCAVHESVPAQGQRKEGRVRGRCIALARRCVSANYRIVNCAPAKGCVWPVLAPARAWVRARGTAEQFGIRGAGAGLRGEGVPIMMFCVRFTPAVCRRVSNRTACDSLRFYSAGRDRHSCVLAALVRLSGLAETRSWSARRCAFCRGACPRFTPGDAVLLSRFVLRSRLLFAAERQTGRLAISCVSIPPGRDRHSCVLTALFGYLPWLVHFGFAFLCGNPDGVTTGIGYAKKSAVMGAFLL